MMIFKEVRKALFGDDFEWRNQIAPINRTNGGNLGSQILQFYPSMEELMKEFPSFIPYDNATWYSQNCLVWRHGNVKIVWLASELIFTMPSTQHDHFDKVTGFKLTGNVANFCDVRPERYKKQVTSSVPIKDESNNDIVWWNGCSAGNIDQHGHLNYTTLLGTVNGILKYVLSIGHLKKSHHLFDVSIDSMEEFFDLMHKDHGRYKAGKE